MGRLTSCDAQPCVVALVEKAGASGLGVRWMRSAIANAIDDAVFDAPDAEGYQITMKDGEPSCRARRPSPKRRAMRSPGCQADGGEIALADFL